MFIESEIVNADGKMITVQGLIFIEKVLNIIPPLNKQQGLHLFKYAGFCVIF